MSNKEVNRRTLESFIKAGALDSLPGNRRQKCMVAPDMLEQKNKDKKSAMEGQMTLFDFAAEDDKQNFQVTFPEVEEYSKEELLAFEKEMLGIYISGHPLEAYEKSWRANVTAVTADFAVDEETEKAAVADGVRVTIGGMITNRSVKATKNGQMMAYVTLEDLVGSVEVLVFPRDYEKYRSVLEEDAKVYIQGRTSIGDDPKVFPQVVEFLDRSDGHDGVTIYLAKERARKVLPPNRSVSCDNDLLSHLYQLLGENNVKVVQKTIESLGKMN